VKLFIVSTVVSQLFITSMSSFESGLGTSMAENIPFIHTMANDIRRQLLDDPLLNLKLLPTILVTVALSTVFNGAVFCAVGLFQLGNILHYFPRYVIMGMISGFGVFLVATAFEISTGDAPSLKSVVNLSFERILQLFCVVAIEVLLRVISSYVRDGELLVSVVMLLVPVFFYMALMLSGGTILEARALGWLFPRTESIGWLETWTYFDVFHVDFLAVFAQLPTIASLAIFTVILVPVRIPSLSLHTGEEVNFDQELIVQGLGNICAGCLGTPHNYLSYSNSVFFHELRGTGRASRHVVTLLTFGMFFYGAEILNLTPRLIAGVIMIHLGIDLLLGTLIKGSKQLNNLEYLCMLLVGLVVSLFGFVQGIGMGVLLACVTFVIESGRQTNIRSVFTGDFARSDTEWSVQQRQKLDLAISEGRLKILIVALQGHLFFGNIQTVVDRIQSYLPASDTLKSKTKRRFTYLVLDCSFLAGADINAISSLSKLSSSLKRRTGISIHGRQLNEECITVFAGLSDSLQTLFQLEIEREKGSLSSPGSHHNLENVTNSSNHNHSNHSDDVSIPLMAEGERRRLSLKRKALTALESVFFNDVSAALHEIEELVLKSLPDLRTLTSLESFRQSFAFSGDEKEHDSPRGTTAQNHWDDLPLVSDPSERPNSSNYVTFSSTTVENNANRSNVSSSTTIHVDVADERAPSTSSTPLTATAHRSYQQPPATYRQGSLTLSLPGAINTSVLPPVITPPAYTHTSNPSNTSSSSAAAATPLHAHSLSRPNTPMSASSEYVISKKRIMNALLELGFNEWDVESDGPILKKLTKKLLKIENIISLPAGQILWSRAEEATMMGLLLNGRLHASSSKGSHHIFAPALVGLGCMIGEKTHSRTLVGVEPAMLLMIPRGDVVELQRSEKQLLSILQTIALRALFSRQKHETLLFSAGSITSSLSSQNISNPNVHDSSQLLIKRALLRDNSK